MNFRNLAVQLGQICVNVDQNCYESLVQLLQHYKSESVVHFDYEYDEKLAALVASKYLLPLLPSAASASQSRPLMFFERFEISQIAVKINLNISNPAFDGGALGLAAPLTFWLTQIKSGKLNLGGVEVKKACGVKYLVQPLTTHYVDGGIAESFTFLNKLSAAAALPDSAEFLLQGIDDFATQQTVADKSKLLAQNAAVTYSSLVSGVCQSATNMTSALTFDLEYQQQRQEQYAEAARGENVGKNAAKAFGMGIWDGLSGIVMKPLKAGKGKIAKGLAQGLLGVVMKPIGGIMDAVGIATAGVQGKFRQAQIGEARAPRSFDAGYITQEETQEENNQEINYTQ